MNLTGSESLSPVSVKDYLTGETVAKRKHEYVAGNVYAVAGGKYRHNLIATNVTGILFAQLKESPCRVLNSDTKVRIGTGTNTCFYYPDVSVVCGDDIGDDVFQDRPKIVIEVLSKTTRRIDEGEKKDGFLSLDSLSVYLMIEQQVAAAKMLQRSSDGKSFEEHVFVGMDQIVPLNSIDASLRLADVYAKVDFSSEPTTD